MKPLIIFCLLALVSYFILPQENSTQINKQPISIKIKVSGAVKEEQEVELQSESMFLLLEKIELEENANCSCLNLNRVLKHEDEVYIPSNDSLNISLNKASQEELMQIKGIGPAIASRIIEYRETNSFMSIEDIMNIKGIGYKTYVKLRSFLCL